MFCVKCGKEITDKSKYCPYCGQEQISEIQLSQDSVEQNNETIKSQLHVSNVSNTNGIIGGLSAVDIILGILFLVLFLKWSAVFFPNYGTTLNAFSLLDNGDKTLGLILYCVPFAILLLILVVGIRGIIRHQYHISMGVFTVVFGICMKIGSGIFKEISFDTFEMIFYRIFWVYDSNTITTILLGGAITVLLFSKSQLRRGI